MRIDELKHGLHDEVDRVAPADATSGRRATDRRVRRHQRRQAMTTVAVGLVVVLAVAAILRQGPTDELPVLVGPGVPDAPHLTAGYVPDGVDLYRVFELPTQDPDIGFVPLRSRTTIYATADDVDTAEGSFAVTVNRYAPDRVRAAAPNSTATTTETTNTSGTAAPMQQESTVRLGDRLVTTLRSDGKVSTIAVTSRSLTDADRVALNHSVVLAPDGETIERIEVPAGYHRVAESGSFGVLDFQGVIVSLGAEGAAAVYTEPPAKSTARRFVLGQVRDDQDSLDGFRWYLSQDRTLKVRGHDAIIGSYVSGSSMSARTTSSSSSDGSSSSGSSSSDGSSGTTPAAKEIFGLVVAWFESDGNLVVIQADQIDEAELLRIAEGLQPLSDDEWRQFADTHSTTTLPANCTATSDGGRTCHSSGSVIAVPVPVSPGSTPGNR